MSNKTSAMSNNGVADPKIYISMIGNKVHKV